MMLLLLVFSSEEQESRYHRLYREYSPILLRIARSILTDESLSCDAVQECFMKIFVHIDDLEKISEEKEIAYITQILKNTAIDIYRKEKNRMNVTDSSEEALYQIAADFDVDEILSAAELTETLIQEVRKFSVKDQSIILFRFFYDKSYKEIGELLEMDEGAVRVRLMRLKRKLAENIKTAEGGDLK